MIQVEESTCCCAEKDALRRLCDAFSAEMFDKMCDKMEEGFKGWDDTKFRSQMSKAFNEQRVSSDPDYVDIANYAAFLWNLDSGGPRS